MKHLKNHSGEKYNMFTLMQYAGYTKDGCYVWVCKCDCGNIVERKSADVIAGRIKSCGCLKKQSKTIKHGLSSSRIYGIHQKMKDRCYRKNVSNYKDYGGRGIKVCDEWLGENGFQNFYDWAMANGYSDDLSIDRIDVNGDYTPDNCRWADQETQSNNKRTNRYITYNGETLTIAQWSRKLGISENALTNRLNKWSLEEAMTTPLAKYRLKQYTFNGESHSLSEWSRILNLNYFTLKRREKRGWNVEDMLTKNKRNRR